MDQDKPRQVDRRRRTGIFAGSLQNPLGPLEWGFSLRWDPASARGRKRALSAKAPYQSEALPSAVLLRYFAHGTTDGFEVWHTHLLVSRDTTIPLAPGLESSACGLIKCFLVVGRAPRAEANGRVDLRLAIAEATLRLVSRKRLSRVAIAGRRANGPPEIHSAAYRGVCQRCRGGG